MILQTLDRIRSDNARDSGHSYGDDSRRTMASPDSDGQSLRSTDSTISTPTSARAALPTTARFTKRHSNNLFGSGRFRDDTYFRSVAAQRTGSQRGAVSVAQSESSVGNERSGSTSYADSLRPTTPEDNTPSPSVQSTPEKPDSTDVTAMHTQISSSDFVASVSNYRLPNAALRRASLALEEVIKEIEEEAEDEIVMPRSVPPSRAIIGEQNGPVTDTVRTSLFPARLVEGAI